MVRVSCCRNRSRPTLQHSERTQRAPCRGGLSRAAQAAVLAGLTGTKVSRLWPGQVFSFFN